MADILIWETISTISLFQLFWKEVRIMGFVRMQAVVYTTILILTECSLTFNLSKTKLGILMLTMVEWLISSFTNVKNLILTRCLNRAASLDFFLTDSVSKLWI